MAPWQRFLILGLALAVFARAADAPELLNLSVAYADPYSLAVSPDGKLFATGSSLDGAVVFHDSATGLPLRILHIATEGGIGTGRQVLSLTFSPLGRWLAAAASNELVTVWEVESGRQVWVHLTAGSFATFDGEDRIAIPFGIEDTQIYDFVNNVEVGEPFHYGVGGDWIAKGVLTPDGKTLVTGQFRGSVAIWDVATRKMLRSVAAGSNEVTALAVNSSGSVAAAGTRDKHVTLIDISRGVKIRELTGPTADITGIAFDPDGRRVAASAGMLDGQVRIWDIASGTPQRTISLNEPYAAPRTLVWDPLNRWVAVTWGRVRRWNPDTGDESIADFSGAPSSITFNRAWRWMLTQNKNFVRIWDASTGQLAREFSLPGTAEIWWAMFSAGDEEVMAGFTPEKNGPFQLRTWNVTTGAEVSTLTLTKPLPYGSFAVRVSSDGRLVAVAALDGKTASIWDVRNPAGGPRAVQLPSGFSAVDLSGNELAFSTRGQWLYALSKSGLMVWNAATGAETLRGTVSQGYKELIAVVSPDERWLALLNGGSTLLQIFDLRSPAAPPRTVRIADPGVPGGGGPLVRLCAFSAASDLVGCHTGQSVELWRVTDGAVLKPVKADFDNPSFRFTPDGKLTLNDGAHQRAHIVDPQSGKEESRIECRDCGGSDFEFSPDGAFLAVTGMEPGPVRFFDRKSGAQAASLTLLRDTPDWLVTTPGGLFDGSPDGWKQIFWRFGSGLKDVLPVEAFFSEYFRPGLLSLVLEGTHPAPAAQIAEKDRRQPQIALSASAVHGGSADVTLDLHAAAGVGVRDVRLFRNGSLVKIWRGDATLDTEGKGRLQFAVRLAAGTNRLTAYAFNHDNVKSPDAALEIAGPAEVSPAILYILAIGVNRYAASALNLQFAVPDSRDFAETLQARQVDVKRFAEVKPIPLTDQDATRGRILQELAALAAKARPQDAVIVFFAGHGRAQDPRFYLIPHDAGDGTMEALVSHGISDLDLEQAFESIDAGFMAMVIDACYSGQALEAPEQRRGPMNSTGLAQLAYEKGMAILAATQSDGLAGEAVRLGHGLLTFALVEEGLKKGLADNSPRDGLVLLREWFDYAVGRVPELSRGKQADRGVGRDQPAPSAQKPRAFYRREPERDPIVIAKTGAGN